MRTMPEEMFPPGVGRGDLWPMVRRIFRERKWLMLLVFLAVAAPALWTSYRAEPRFTSSAVIIISQSADPYPVFREWVPHNSIPILMILLRGRGFAEEVVNSLTKATFEELLTHRDSRDYTATLTNLYRRLLRQPIPQVSPKDMVIQELQLARVKFVPRAGGLLEIQASASSPQAAVDLVAAYIEVLQNRTRTMNRGEARAVREFLESTVTNLSGTFKESEQTLAEFRKERGISQTDPLSQGDLMRVAQLEDALAETQINEKMLQARLAFIRTALAQNVQMPPKPKPAEPAPAPQVDPFGVKVLQARLGKLEARYIDLLGRYTEGHPQVKNVKAELDEVRTTLEGLQTRQTRQEAAPAAETPPALINRGTLVQQAVGLEAESNALQVRRQSLQAQIQLAKARVSHLSQDALQHAALQRRADIHRSMLTMLQDKIFAANVRSPGDLQGSTHVIEPPNFPMGSSSSRSIKMAFLGIVLGALLGVGGALALDYLDDSVRTDGELEALMEAPVLASISRMTLPKALPAPRTPLRLPGPGPS